MCQSIHTNKDDDERQQVLQLSLIALETKEEERGSRGRNNRIKNTSKKSIVAKLCKCDREGEANKGKRKMRKKKKKKKAQTKPIFKCHALENN